MGQWLITDVWVSNVHFQLWMLLVATVLFLWFVYVWATRYRSGGLNVGTVAEIASRLCDEAKPGQILISPRVLMKVENAVKVEPVGEFELKGIRRPLAAYNVLGAV